MRRAVAVSAAVSAALGGEPASARDSSATGGPRTVRISGGPGASGGPAVALLALADAGPPPDAASAALTATARRLLCLDDDLSAFYARAAADPDLAWACTGAGRMMRSPAVFEDVVKTVCTTNCAWSATERMVGALVEHLGEPAPGAPPGSSAGRGPARRGARPGRLPCAPSPTRRSSWCTPS